MGKAAGRIIKGQFSTICQIFERPDLFTHCDCGVIAHAMKSHLGLQDFVRAKPEQDLASPCCGMDVMKSPPRASGRERSVGKCRMPPWADRLEEF